MHQSVPGQHLRSAYWRYDWATVGYIAAVLPADSAHPHADPLALDECVPRIREGDAAAFEQLFRALHEPLLAFATRYTRDPSRAEELIQDVFFVVWQTRAQWEPRGSVRAYLFGAVRNRALNLRRRDTLEQDWANEEAHESSRTLHPTPASVDAELEHQELLTRAHAALDALPERCRLAMHLRWREGMSYAEIAEVLGISNKGVENQLARGLRAVRARLLGD